MHRSPLPPSILRYRGRARPRWQRLSTYWLWRLSRQSDRPESIARGVAVGVFAGILPMLGQSFVAIALAWLVRGSKVTAAAMTFISNPLTTFPIFFFDYWLGCHILDQKMIRVVPEHFESWDSIKALGVDFVIAIFLGGVIFGAAAGGLSYFLGHALVKRLRHERSMRPRLRTAASAADSPVRSDRAV